MVYGTCFYAFVQRFLVFFGSWTLIFTNAGAVETGNDNANEPAGSRCTVTKVVAYFPAWQGKVDDIQFSKLTHVNYAFLLPNPDGSLQPIEDPAKLHHLVSAAGAEGVKVGIAVGGWNNGNDDAFVALTADRTARANFADNILTFVNRYRLDGVDLDWEYPYTSRESSNFAALVKELSARLRTDGKYLTAAVYAEGDVADAINDSVMSNVDFLNLMAYDLNERNHSPYSYALATIDYWQRRGLPREKSVLGVPFYARPSFSSYKNKVDASSANACRDTDGRDYWNGIPTIRRKARLVLSDTCGMMIWDISQDTDDETSLLTALREVIDGEPPGYACDRQATSSRAWGWE